MSWNIKVHSTDLSVLVSRLWGKQAQAQSFRKQMVRAHTNTHAHDAHTHTCTHTILHAHYDWTLRKHRRREPASPERWFPGDPQGQRQGQAAPPSPRIQGKGKNKGVMSESLEKSRARRRAGPQVLSLQLRAPADQELTFLQAGPQKAEGGHSGRGAPPASLINEPRTSKAPQPCVWLISWDGSGLSLKTLAYLTIEQWVSTCKAVWNAARPITDALPWHGESPPLQT